MIIEQLFQRSIEILRGQYTLESSLNCIVKLFLLRWLLELSEEKESEGEIYIPQNLKWFNLGDRENGVANSLNQATVWMEEHNSILQGLLTNSEGNYWNQFKDELLASLLDLFSLSNLKEIGHKDPEEIGKAFNFLIEKNSRDGVFTPQSITRMIVKIIDPREENTIYDPVCGSGEFLVSCVNHIRKNNGNINSLKIYAQSRVRQNWLNTRTNLIINGFYNAHIYPDDSLAQPVTNKNGLHKFDFVLCNPPFGMKYSKFELTDLDRFPYGIPKNVSREILLLQYVLASLSDFGKGVIILPRGAISRKGGEQIVRENIIKDNVIEAVIELPQNLFKNTSIPVVALFLNKNKFRKEEIFFVDASKEYKEGRGQNLFQSEHIDKIVHAFKNHEDIGSFSRMVGLDEVVGNNYLMNPNFYVCETHELEINIDSEIEKLHQIESRKLVLSKEISDHLKSLGIDV